MASSTAWVSSWLTTGDKSRLLFPEWLPLTPANASAPHTLPILTVDPSTTFQTIDGFGFALTGGSAQLLLSLPPAVRWPLLVELFSTAPPHAGIGISFLRLSIGASDLSSSVFSYDDLPPGQTDPELRHFSLGPDLDNVVPVLQEILAIRPDLKLIAAPWSPPPWMKSNGNSSGGSLLEEYYPVYAQYLVRYVQAMAANGISLYALTPQNEPLNPHNNPSCVMSAAEQTRFIRDHLGPAFAAQQLATKIVCYDHNADRPQYPLTVLSDPAARAFVDGSAFHLYAGRMEALSLVHDLFPDKNLYFTEQWVGAPSDFGPNLLWGVADLIVAGTRNWCRCVLEWNLAANQDWEPHTPGGCTNCLGGLTIYTNRSANETAPLVVRNEGYYIIAHASKFVPPGAVRIDSTLSTLLPNAAFLTPDGHVVLIVANPDVNASQSALVFIQSQQFKFHIPPQSVMTFQTDVLF